VRAFVRARVNFPVTYERESGDRSSPSAPKPAEAIDLGGGGVRLATDEDLPLGTVLLLRLRLPKVGREMVARGRIVLSFYKANEALFFHGIAFTQIDPRDQAEIVTYVTDKAAEDPAD
jgi:hypothetical protein